MYIPENVTSIGSYAFYGCTNMESVTLPSLLLEINNYTFYSCSSLEEITIPELVENIGNSAFNRCTNLAKIISLNTTPPICGVSVFDNINSKCVLTVPEESLYAYATADTWKEFLTNYHTPEVTTYEATDVGLYSATIGGMVTRGTEDIKEQGLEYGAEGEEGQTITFESDEMSYTLEGLTPSTTYIYHAFATTASVTIYGENMSFTTEDDTSGINNVTAGSVGVKELFSISGQKLNAPIQGVNIFRNVDGMVKKVFINKQK